MVDSSDDVAVLDIVSFWSLVTVVVVEASLATVETV
jgi:hypothetical protein